MRKVHYRVVLDVFVHENEDVDPDVSEAFFWADFQIELDKNKDEFDVIDINVESVEVTDSR